MDKKINILNEVLINWKNVANEIGGDTVYMSAEYELQPNADRYGYNVPGIAKEGCGGFSISAPPLYRTYKKALQIAQTESAKKGIEYILDYVRNVVWVYVVNGDPQWDIATNPLRPWNELNYWPEPPVDQYWPLHVNSRGEGYYDSPPVWVINAVKIN